MKKNIFKEIPVEHCCKNCAEVISRCLYSDHAPWSSVMFWKIPVSAYVATLCIIWHLWHHDFRPIISKNRETDRLSTVYDCLFFALLRLSLSSHKVRRFFSIWLFFFASIRFENTISHFSLLCCELVTFFDSNFRKKCHFWHPESENRSRNFWKIVTQQVCSNDNISV